MKEINNNHNQTTNFHSLDRYEGSARTLEASSRVPRHEIGRFAIDAAMVHKQPDLGVMPHAKIEHPPHSNVFTSSEADLAGSVIPELDR